MTKKGYLPTFYETVRFNINLKRKFARMYTVGELIIYLPIFFCSLLLLMALFTDIRSKTIPNIITVPAIICGILFNTWNAGCNEGFFLP